MVPETFNLALPLEEKSLVGDHNGETKLSSPNVSFTKDLKLSSFTLRRSTAGSRSKPQEVH